MVFPWTDLILRTHLADLNGYVEMLKRVIVRNVISVYIASVMELFTRNQII